MCLSLFFPPNMNAMLFAAGMGTRLKPLTDNMPKALVPVEGKPLIDIALQRLKQAGAERVVINIHHFADQIENHLSRHDYGLDIVLSDERAKLLDTGGGLRHAANLLNLPGDERPILLHNVDILSNADLASFFAAHTDDAVTLLVSPRQTNRYLLFDGSLRLKGWLNVQTGEVRSPYAGLCVERLLRFAFAGIHTFSPRLFPLLSAFPDKFSITDFYLSVCDQVPIRAHVATDLQLLDVGKLDSLHIADGFLRQLEATR